MQNESDSLSAVGKVTIMEATKYANTFVEPFGTMISVRIPDRADY